MELPSGTQSVLGLKKRPISEHVRLTVASRVSYIFQFNWRMSSSIDSGFFVICFNPSCLSLIRYPAHGWECGCQAEYLGIQHRIKRLSIPTTVRSTVVGGLLCTHLCFPSSSFLNKASRQGAGNREGLEERSNGVAYPQGNELLSMSEQSRDDRQ